MKELLSQISKGALELNPDFFSAEEKETKWIGKNPATDEAISIAEAKLGIKLPEDVVALYKISNGTSVILNQTFSGFLPIQEVDWLKNGDPALIDCYSEMGEAYVNDLKNSIIIAGIAYPHSVLLIQPCDEHKDWRYWEFASYFPGERPFQGIEKYLEQVNDFLIKQNTHFNVSKLNFPEGTIHLHTKNIYAITIPVSTFLLDGLNTDTTLRLDFIKLSEPIENYINKTVNFPVNPDEGYIDGSIYLRGAHNPVDVTEIKFIKLNENKLTIEMTMNFIFEFEGIGFKNENLTREFIVAVF